MMRNEEEEEEDGLKKRCTSLVIKHIITSVDRLSKS